jgi:hypothetical protein
MFLPISSKRDQFPQRFLDKGFWDLLSGYFCQPVEWAWYDNLSVLENKK